MTGNRKLAAILAADVVGFSTMMQADEVGTLPALKQCRKEIWSRWLLSTAAA
jgi:adenylate cyclase